MNLFWFSTMACLSQVPLLHTDHPRTPRTLAASCFCCAWKSLIQFYAFSKVLFTFLYFFVVSHPLCQTLCSFPSSLTPCFLKKLFLHLRSVTWFNHIGLLFLWIFLFDAEACCRVSLNNLISATSALLFLAADFNEFPHFYVVPLFKGKYLIWYIQAM